MCESGEQCKPSDATSSIVVAIVIMGSVVHISSHKIMSASSSLISSKSNCWQHFHFQVALTLLFSIVSFLRSMSTILTIIFYRPFQIHIRTAPKCIGCTLYVISRYWALGLVSYFKSLASYALLFPPRPNWGWFRLIYRFLVVFSSAAAVVGNLDTNLHSGQLEDFQHTCLLNF